jgi:hypothetical protein
MRNAGNKIPQVQKPDWKALLGLAVLVYALLAIESSSRLPHIHHDHTAHAVDSCLEPCHIAIYHPGESGTCSHDFHFTQGEEYCPHCLLIPVRFIPPPDIKFAIADVSDVEFPDTCAAGPRIRICDAPLGRGPPACLTS